MDPPTAAASVRTRTFATLIDNPLYRRFYLGQGVSLTGTWLQDAAVSWIVFEVTRSEIALGLVSAAGILPGLFVGLIAGALADRVAPKAMVLAMQVGQMLLAFLLALLVGLGHVPIWALALVLALTRVCVTFELPSRQVFMYEIVGRSSLMNAIALNSGLFNASRVVGPALAGLLLAFLGRMPCFLLNGASYVAAIAALLSIPTPPRLERKQAREPAALLGGIAYLGRDRRVRWLFLLMAFFGVVGMGYSALQPAYARVVVGTGKIGYGLLMASAGLGATLGALVVASIGGLPRRERLVSAGMAVFGVSLAGAGILPVLIGPGAVSAALAACCLLGAGFGGLIFFAATQTLIQTTVPDELRGRIMGLWMIIYSGSVPLGSLWAGWLASRWGVPRVLEISSVLCVATAAGVAFSGVLSEPGRDRRAAP